MTTKTVAGVEIIILTGASHYFKLSNTTVFNNELTLPFSTDLAQQDCRRQRYDQYCPANPGRPAPRGAPVPETHRSTRPTDVWATSRSSRRPDRGDHPAGTNRHGSNRRMDGRLSLLQQCWSNDSPSYNNVGVTTVHPTKYVGETTVHPTTYVIV